MFVGSPCGCVGGHSGLLNLFQGLAWQLREGSHFLLQVQTSLILGPQAGFHFSLWAAESHVAWEGLEIAYQILTWTWVDSPPH